MFKSRKNGFLFTLMSDLQSVGPLNHHKLYLQLALNSQAETLWVRDFAVYVSREFLALNFIKNQFYVHIKVGRMKQVFNIPSLIYDMKSFSNRGRLRSIHDPTRPH